MCRYYSQKSFLIPALFLGQGGVNRKLQTTAEAHTWKCLYKAVLSERFPKRTGKYSQAQRLRGSLLLSVLPSIYLTLPSFSSTTLVFHDSLWITQAIFHQVQELYSDSS